MDIITITKQKLKESFPEADIKIIDNSSMHAPHGNSGAHLEILISSKQFIDKTLIQQHQLVYQSLKEEMKEKIHALKLTTKIKNE